MSTSKIKVIIMLLSMMTAVAYGGILYNGNEYTETMLPYSYKSMKWGFL